MVECQILSGDYFFYLCPTLVGAKSTNYFRNAIRVSVWWGEAFDTKITFKSIALWSPRMAFVQQPSSNFNILLTLSPYKTLSASLILAKCRIFVTYEPRVSPGTSRAPNCDCYNRRIDVNLGDLVANLATCNRQSCIATFFLFGVKDLPISWDKHLFTSSSPVVFSHQNLPRFSFLALCLIMMLHLVCHEFNYQVTRVKK